MNYKLLFEKAASANITDIEIYETDSKETVITMFNGKIDKNQISNTKSFTARAIYNGKMSYVQFENENEDVDDLINNLVENAKYVTSKKESFIYGGSDEYPQLSNNSDDFSSIPNSEKIALLNRLVEKIYGYSQYVHLIPELGYSEEEVTIKIVNSKGLNLTNTNAVAQIYLEVVAKQGEETKTSFYSQGVKHFKDFDVDKMASEAAKKSVDKLGGTPCESGSYPVIMDKGAMGNLLGAFVSMFSGESAMQNVSLLVGKENTKVMSEKVDIVEEPLNQEALFNRAFDDEGVACSNKYFVEKGVFKGFAHNLKTAHFFNTASTGNGYKGVDGISVSGKNIYIKNGNSTVDELISSVDKGLLITDITGLHAGVNPISGDFSVQSTGFMIEHGKVTKPVTLIVVSGNFLKIMNDVEMIANDLTFSDRNVLSPSIKFGSLMVSGK